MSSNKWQLTANSWCAVRDSGVVPAGQSRVRRARWAEHEAVPRSFKSRQWWGRKQRGGRERSTEQRYERVQWAAETEGEHPHNRAEDSGVRLHVYPGERPERKAVTAEPTWTTAWGLEWAEDETTGFSVAGATPLIGSLNAAFAVSTGLSNTSNYCQLSQGTQYIIWNGWTGFTFVVTERRRRWWWWWWCRTRRFTCLVCPHFALILPLNYYSPYSTLTAFGTLPF